MQDRPHEKLHATRNRAGNYKSRVSSSDRLKQINLKDELSVSSNIDDSQPDDSPDNSRKSEVTGLAEFTLKSAGKVDNELRQGKLDPHYGNAESKLAHFRALFGRGLQR